MEGIERVQMVCGELAKGGEARAGQREYRCRLVRSGRVRASGNQPGGLELLPQALETACQQGLFDGKAVFLDHAGLLEYPSLKDLAGVTQGSQFNPAEGCVEAVLRMYDTPAAQAAARLLDAILADAQTAPDVGLSIVFWPEYEPGGDGTASLAGLRRVAGIRHVESVDLVFEPAADGRVLEALNSNLTIGGENMQTNENEQVHEVIQPEGGDRPAARTGASQENLAASSLGQSHAGQANQTPDWLENQADAWRESQAITFLEGQADEWLHALGGATARMMIAGSGLPQVSQERLSERSYQTPRQVERAIEDERLYLGALQADQVVQLGGRAPRAAQVNGMRGGVEQLALALDALLAGTRPAEVQPLSGIRELYHLLSGDYEMNGLFQAERVYLANVNSSTMAGLVANALNKRVVNEFMQFPQWWQPVASEEDFGNLQQVKWITLGGVGELPTVAEGAAYSELTWDDQTETATFVKKGGYLGLTLEAIDKDDTGRIRAAPRALAQAAWLTLAKAVSAIFTDNSGVGPAMSDGLALFHSTHGNLGTTALSVSSYAAARTAMRKMTEVNSGERLGALTAPKYLLVPPDLEITALQVLASQADYSYALSNGQAAPANVFAEGDGFDSRMNAARQRVVVVDLWTDTNNWAAASDPRLYPTIGIAYRYGRTPEIFSVASPTAGLMFTNDTMPVKVRFFFAAGPMDYRGLYKANVA